MLDINAWFFAQLANFFLLFIFLNAILFKPVLELFRQRDEKTKGALESAKELDKQKDGVLAQIDMKLSDARVRAREISEGLSKEGADIQKETLDSAQKESMEINRKAKEDIRAAAEKARAALKSDVEAFSKHIVDKLVGA